GISLIKVLADPYTQLPSVTFWLLGGLSSITLRDVALILPCLVIGMIPLLLLRWRVNVMTLDDEEARALGVNTTNARVTFIICATLLSSAAIAFTGIIAWVGLIIPHVARLLVGPDFARLLPASALVGAIFLILADTLARSMVSIELPLGVLTAPGGAPFFLLLLARSGRQSTCAPPSKPMGWSSGIRGMRSASHWILHWARAKYSVCSVLMVAGNPPSSRL